MCEYCKTPHKNLPSNRGDCIDICLSTKIIDIMGFMGDDIYYNEIPINYCPMCGRKLENLKECK